MKKRLIILVIGLVLMAVCAKADSSLKQGMPNTIALTNGEVIYDLNGEWAVSTEHFGAWKRHSVSPDIIDIKQEGGSFVGVTLLGSTIFKKGDKRIIGELSKSGFKEVKIISRIGALYSNGKIIDNGNKIIVDYDNLLKMTIIRKP